VVIQSLYLREIDAKRTYFRLRKKFSCQYIKRAIAEYIKRAIAEYIKRATAEYIKRAIAEYIKRAIAEYIKRAIAEYIKRAIAESAPSLVFSLTFTKRSSFVVNRRARNVILCYKPVLCWSTGITSCSYVFGTSSLLPTFKIPDCAPWSLSLTLV
jgi:hypothetical protein